jgi:acyl-CoA reductase-like NAD-dependent aldehyde dehydrogenase
MYINGSFVQGEAKQKIEVLNPATEAIIDEVWRGTAADINTAVESAKNAFASWRSVPGMEKAAMLHQAAEKMRAHHDELTELLIQEEGKPVEESDEELWWGEETLDYYAEIARNERGRVIPPGDPDQFNFILKEPWGVVGCIIPWNFPILLLNWKLAPALAAGNTVVIKPSEYTPLTTLKMIELAFDHFPPGVINVVTGYGLETGEPLTRHPDVRMIAFTGSLETGQRIASIAAPQMKNLHLELGGKDPMVIGPDVDISTAVSALAYSALLNAGQVCTSTERVYVHESIFDQFATALTDFVNKLRLGNPMDKSTDIGPMMDERFIQKVEAQIQDAVDAGAKVLTGGKRSSQFDKGYFFEPTILTNVDHSMKIMSEETFGPTIPLMPYKTMEEGIRFANDCQFGLGATLMSHDARFVKKFFEGVEAGTIWINDPLTDNFAGPFGGMKMSGLARELGQEGFDAFTQVKHVHWDVEGKKKDFWYPYG